MELTSQSMEKKLKILQKGLKTNVLLEKLTIESQLHFGTLCIL